MKWIIGVILLATVTVTPAVGAGVMLDRSYGWKDGIGLSTLPLVQKTAGSISVRLINSGGSEMAVPVTLLGSDSKTVIARATVAVPANGAANAAIPWTPHSNGWKRITVVAGEERASVIVPVTVRRFYFSWYNNKPEFDRTLKYPNVVLSADKATHDYWASRGAIPCLWKGAGSSVKFKTPDEYASYLVENVAASGAKGILIDEMGSYSECGITEDIYYRGLAELTQRSDDQFVGLWVCRPLALSAEVPDPDPQTGSAPRTTQPCESRSDSPLPFQAGSDIAPAAAAGLDEPRRSAIIQVTEVDVRWTVHGQGN